MSHWRLKSAELIPVSVSELFFFDGEKIAELADDNNGQALGDAIKKLLGLDMFDTLSADLGIYLRNISKERAGKDSKTEIEKFQLQLDKSEQEIATEFERIEEIQANIRKIESNLSEQGGAWASTRESEILKQATLQAEKETTKAQLQELLSGSYPLSIAESSALKTLSQLKEENAYQKSLHTAKLVKGKLDTLATKLKKSLDEKTFPAVNKALLTEFKSITNIKAKVSTIHGKAALYEAGYLLNS